MLKVTKVTLVRTLKPVSRLSKRGLLMLDVRRKRLSYKSTPLLPKLIMKFLRVIPMSQLRGWVDIWSLKS